MLIASIVIIAVVISFVTFIIFRFKPEALMAETPDTKAVTKDVPVISEPTVPPPDNTVKEPPVRYPEEADEVINLTGKISSDYAMLVDAETMEITAAKDPYGEISPASLTKIMTVITAYENIDDPNDTFVMTSSILDPLREANASVAGFVEDELVTVRDLFYGAVLSSGADCTIALAEYVSGSESAFIELMNAKAEELGLKHSHFVNTSGLDAEGHYSCLSDIAVMMKYAMDIPFLATVFGTDKALTSKTLQHPEGLTLESTTFARMGFNHLYGKMTIKGGKTGFTDDARHCLATYAVDADGHPYIFVCAHASTMYIPITDTSFVYGECVKTK